MAAPDDYPLFDWLRFILASLVALVHAKVISWTPAGNLAVLVFFALSGFLIGGILFKADRASLPRFFFNRATRIWAPYFFAVAVLYSLSATRDPVTLRWWDFLFHDVTFTHNWFSVFADPADAIAAGKPLQGTNAHFWSISVEEQFYLFAPLIIVLLRFGRSPMLWSALSVSLLAIQQTDFASISLGVLVASLKPFGDWHLRKVAILLIAVGAVVACATMAILSYNYGAPIFAVCVVLLCARPGTRKPIGIFAGAISYPMYLNHWMGIFAGNFLAKHIYLGPELVTGIISYFGGVLAGTVCYLLVDRTVLMHRNQYYSPYLGLLAALVAYSLLFGGLSFGIIFSMR